MPYDVTTLSTFSHGRARTLGISCGPEGELGQRVPQTTQILLGRLDHHVGIAHGNRLSVQPQRRAADQQRRTRPSAARIAAASTGAGYPGRSCWALTKPP